MKKKLILLLGMLVLTVSLIGCGNKNDAQTYSDVPETENVPVTSSEMDFTEYENGNKDISEVVDSQPGYDTMKIIVEWRRDNGCFFEFWCTECYSTTFSVTSGKPAIYIKPAHPSSFKLLTQSKPAGTVISYF